MKEKEDSRSGQGTKVGNVKSEKGANQKSEQKKKTDKGKSSKK